MKKNETKVKKLEEKVRYMADMYDKMGEFVDIMLTLRNPVGITLSTDGLTEIDELSKKSNEIFQNFRRIADDFRIDYEREWIESQIKTLTEINAKLSAFLPKPH